MNYSINPRTYLYYTIGTDIFDLRKVYRDHVYYIVHTDIVDHGNVYHNHLYYIVHTDIVDLRNVYIYIAIICSDVVKN